MKIPLERTDIQTANTSVEAAFNYIQSRYKKKVLLEKLIKPEEQRIFQLG